MADPTLEQIGQMVQGKTCQWCGTALPTKIDHYNHTGGSSVAGFEMKQWLSVQCPKCEYEWSLWKLGIYPNREAQHGSD